jgi:hypothetical protein
MIAPGIAAAVAGRRWLLIAVVCVAETLTMTGFSAYRSLLPATSWPCPSSPR